jgi:hypothetical protein
MCRQDPFAPGGGIGTSEASTRTGQNNREKRETYIHIPSESIARNFYNNFSDNDEFIIKF